MATASVQTRAKTESLHKDLVDEFTAPRHQRNLLEQSRGLVQSLFSVVLTVLDSLETFSCVDNVEEKPQGRIWLQLKGKKDALVKAKEYVKSLCEPEMEEKESYPKEMHCIFAGAKGLFFNRLIMDTSANIAMLEIGVLSIKGGTEPVVMAQSHIQQFVKLFQNNESLPQDREPEVKRRFKRFVEVYADKYTMDLLLLPSALKEELLSLVLNVLNPAMLDDLDLEISMANVSTIDQIPSCPYLDQSKPSRRTPVTELTTQLDSVFSSVPETEPNPKCESVSQVDRLCIKRRSSENEDQCRKKQFSIDCIQVDGPIIRSDDASDVPIIDLLSESSNTEDSLILLDEEETVSPEMEYKILVNFFKTMGYSRCVVEKVIGQLGQSEEPLKLLEAIEGESKKLSSPPVDSKEIKTVHKGLPISKPETQPRQEVPIKPIPSVDLTNDGLLSETSSLATNHIGLGQPMSQRIEAERTSFKNIGFIPRGTSCPSQTDCVHLDRPGPSNQIPVILTKQTPVNFPDLTCAKNSTPMEKNSANCWRPLIPQILEAKSTSSKNISFIPRGTSCPPQTECVHVDRPGPSNQIPVILTKQTAVNFSDSTCAENCTPMEKNSGACWRPAINEPSVTGVQMFLNSIKTPYSLELKNQPGRTDLRHIIIDGSNIAMSHGLQRFFSCRGIAIAVEYFWNKGHRHITVFVPQWRTKRDPNTTEQHFLQQLEKLGILSFTPARTVLGSRIASHDDRFLLHLAERTEGIIVTNDNLREFVVESAAWMKIVKERLLQYTFVGDIFMIPDDPLGRFGPKLDDFLSKHSENRQRVAPTPRGLKRKRWHKH